MSDAQNRPINIYFSLVVDGEVASNYFVCSTFGSMVAAFSSNPRIVLSTDANEKFNTYNIYVEEELADKLRIPKVDEMINAIFQSDPTVVLLTDEQLEIGVGSGWLWDGIQFSKED